MPQHFNVDGFQEFETKIAELEKTNNQIYVLFSGSKNGSDKSWCPDCVTAEPIIEQAFKQAPADAVLIHVSVGDRAFWKDPNCIFRTNARTKLSSVPTLMKWGKPQKLSEDQCNDIETVLLMFED